MSDPYLKVTDRTDELMKLIKSYKSEDVLVGIPASDTGRKETDAGPINNATLMFINEFGSPVNNIPARPAMQIGIRMAQPEIVQEFRSMLSQSLKQGLSGLDKYWNRIGMIASNSVKNVINEQIDIQAPASSTLKTRESRGFKGVKALLVTGQMRNAITWVTRTKVG